MAVQYKGGVNFDVIPQIRNAVSRVETIFSKYGYIPVITSARDSVHGVNSLHYIGAAVDFRSKGLPEDAKQAIFSDLQINFPVPTWWVDLEFLGGDQEHYHLEYKPAKRADINPTLIDDTALTYMPMNQSADPFFSTFFTDTGYIPDSGAAYPSYPSGVVPPQYFTPYEQPVDWTIIVGAAIAVYLLIELTD